MLLKYGVSGGVMPSGAILPWTDACPAGWSRVTAADGRLVRGASAYAASSGGAATHSHTIPFHQHSINTNPTSFAHGSLQGYLYYLHDVQLIGNHRHDVTTFPYAGGAPIGTSSANHTPLYAQLVLCRKD